MNFFNSSFFSELNLQDVLALPREEPPLTSGKSETLMSSSKPETILSDSDNLRNTPSGALSFGAQGPFSSDATDLAGAGSASPCSPNKVERQEAGIWNLGSLVKSIASKSEDIIQAYRKDFEEFGSGLKKETQLLAQVASHAVKDLPNSLETGAYMAQESIESVGQAVEELSTSVWRGTADLIAQGKEAALQTDDGKISASTAVASSSSSTSRYNNVSVSIPGGKYSRFDAQLRAMQHDSSTYCDEPGDASDYNDWKSTFRLANKKKDIENLLAENTFIQGLLQSLVPNVVIEDTFWTRYFYRLHKLHQTEEARADLVKRANALEEEDIGWDTEEEFEETKSDENNPCDRVDDSMKLPSSPKPDEKLLAGSLISKASGSRLSPQILISDHSVNKAVSKTRASEEQEDLVWEVSDVDESNSNDGKHSSNSGAS